jgi:hypothetical protein
MGSMLAKKEGVVPNGVVTPPGWAGAAPLLVFFPVIPFSVKNLVYLAAVRGHKIWHGLLLLIINPLFVGST